MKNLKKNVFKFGFDLLKTNLINKNCNYLFTDQLDRAFVAIRNGSQDERLDLTTRVYLLELIELRAKQWHHSNPVDDYYSQKLMNIDNVRLFWITQF